MKKSKCVNSLKELNDELLNLKESLAADETLWFRGQNEIKYRLIPGSYREIYYVKDPNGLPIQPHKVDVYYDQTYKVMLLDVLCLQILKRLPIFKDKHLDFRAAEYNYRQPSVVSYKHVSDSDILNYNSLKSQLGGNINDWERFAIWQNYGVETPILDWSENLKVAEFFALDRCGHDFAKAENEVDVNRGRPAALYAIIPQRLNQCFFDEHKIFDAKELKENREDRPLAFKGPTIDKRIEIQSGNYVLQGQYITPLDNMDATDDYLYKFILQPKACREIREYLKFGGITNKYIYVDHDLKDTVSNLINQQNLEAVRNTEMKIQTEFWKNSTQKGIPYSPYNLDRGDGVKAIFPFAEGLQI